MANQRDTKTPSVILQNDEGYAKLHTCLLDNQDRRVEGHGDLALKDVFGTYGKISVRGGYDQNIWYGMARLSEDIGIAKGTLYKHMEFLALWGLVLSYEVISTRGMHIHYIVSQHIIGCRFRIEPLMPTVGEVKEMAIADRCKHCKNDEITNVRVGMMHPPTEPLVFLSKSRRGGSTRNAAGAFQAVGREGVFPFIGKGGGSSINGQTPVQSTGQEITTDYIAKDHSIILPQDELTSSTEVADTQAEAAEPINPNQQPVSPATITAAAQLLQQLTDTPLPVAFSKMSFGDQCARLVLGNMDRSLSYLTRRCIEGWYTIHGYTEADLLAATRATIQLCDDGGKRSAPTKLSYMNSALAGIKKQRQTATPQGGTHERTNPIRPQPDSSSRGSYPTAPARARAGGTAVNPRSEFFQGFFSK